VTCPGEKIFQGDEECKSFSKWSYCNGRLVQEEKHRFFKVVKNMKVFQSGLIVMGDLLK
jgi:hypothetical protein